MSIDMENLTPTEFKDLAIKTLKDNKHRITDIRKDFICFIASEIPYEEHFSAYDLSYAHSGKGFMKSITSIYRVLNLFVDCRILCKLHSKNAFVKNPNVQIKDIQSSLFDFNITSIEHKYFGKRTIFEVNEKDNKVVAHDLSKFTIETFLAKSNGILSVEFINKN